MNRNNQKSIRLEHILISFFEEKTGALAEISLKVGVDLESLRSIHFPNDEETTIYHEQLQTTLTAGVQTVLEQAEKYMHRYNQIMINEGHVLKALLNDPMINSIFTEQQKQLLLNLGTTARDMITHLADYNLPRDAHTQQIRKAMKSDSDHLLSFIEKEFSSEWMRTIESGMQDEHPSIFIAIDDAEKIIGFAAYDVYQHKKCYFGPMGVAKRNRVKGIGYSLLHHCLKDMKEIGYEYAIIGGAGPMEFYEKACDAVVIPKKW
ncbi:GNAT family N-acetyltransferase [Ornithinibacillus sp. L9]|uniref:GNAT family N-acetyltransferase n=2 Tax=Ornithinibacillus caprae TaxID=2678566 RepID=A0A6N8FLH2_9BACI|nr:GNAT family N-acetyltransferase [Ornithinibacillus caprae]